MTDSTPTGGFTDRPAPLPRYRELNERERELMLAIAGTDDMLAEIWRAVRDADTADGAGDPTFDAVTQGVTVDPRWLAVAKRHFQDGVSALLRSVARPRDPYDD